MTRAVSELSLVCPSCKKRQPTKREDDDPADAAEVHVMCPACNGGDFDFPRYFRADGAEVLPRWF